MTTLTVERATAMTQRRDRSARDDLPSGTPYLQVESTDEVFPLGDEISTIGRGEGVSVAIEDPSVSRLHAEIVRRGPHLYVSDMGLSTNGTRVNGRPIGRRVLHDGDIVTFGAARARVGGVEAPEDDA
ncbi:MAG: FHA domain-containing protein, partial [Frankia sp.]|nr:FHA domain-containing protein [Frankia sp.]